MQANKKVLNSLEEVIGHYQHMAIMHTWGDSDRCRYIEKAVYDSISFGKLKYVEVDNEDCDCDD